MGMGNGQGGRRWKKEAERGRKEEEGRGKLSIM